MLCVVYVILINLDESMFLLVEIISACWDVHCAIAFLLVQAFRGNRPLNLDTLLPGQPIERKILRRVCCRLFGAKIVNFIRNRRFLFMERERMENKQQKSHKWSKINIYHPDRIPLNWSYCIARAIPVEVVPKIR